MSRNWRTALLATAVAGSALLGPAQVGAAKTPWSGNAAAIAYYRTSVAKTNSLPALRDVYIGYYWIWDNANVIGRGGNSQFKLYWGYASKPAAEMVRANATFVSSLVDGKQSWYVVSFTNPCAIGSTCASSIAPLDIYVTKSGDYWGYQLNGSSQVNCWHPATQTAAWIEKTFTLGAPWKTYGKYSPLVKKGNRVFATSTYTNQGAKVTETDSIDATSKFFTGSVYHVGRSTKFAATSYSVFETDPASVPAAPSLSLCR